MTHLFPRRRDLGSRLQFHSQALSIVACVTLSGCFAAQPEDFADSQTEAARSFRLEVGTVRDTSLTFPVAAIPRLPTFRVFGPQAEDDVHLFTGTIDDALISNLSRGPLRAGHRSRVVEGDTEAHDGFVTFVPHDPLPNGENFVVAVADFSGVDHGVFVAEVTVAAEGGGAVLLSAWPPQEARGVPTSLPRTLLAFDAVVEDLTVDVTRLLAGEVARDVEVTTAEVSCVREGLAGAFCLEVVLPRLDDGATYRTRASGIDRGGVPVRAQTLFTTAPASPTLEPLPLTCALDEIADGAFCVLATDTQVTVRARFGAPVRAFLESERGASGVVAPRGEVKLTLDRLAPDQILRADLVVFDLADVLTAYPLELRTAEPLATIAISEVCANPYGDEPGQEYVELHNHGERSVNLGGLSVSDEEGAMGDVLPAVWLPPDGRALVVSDAFLEEPDEDPPPAPAAALLFIGRSIGNGLRNAGDSLFLRDGSLRRLSSAPAVAVPEGECLLRDGDTFVIGECSPGR